MLHVLSLVAAALTAARGKAAIGRSSRIRECAEADRIGTERSLLEEELEIKDARWARVPSGAVNRIQRFGSSVNLNVHFHALVLDGVYTAASPFASPVFHEASELFDADVEHLVETIRDRVLRLLRRRGFLTDEGEVSLGEEEASQGVLPLLLAASIQGRVGQGPEATTTLTLAGSVES